MTLLLVKKLSFEMDSEMFDINSDEENGMVCDFIEKYVESVVDEVRSMIENNPFMIINQVTLKEEDI